MPNKKLFMAPPDVFEVHNTLTGVTSRANVAAFHSLYETVGYVGPRFKGSPQPIHEYNFYRDRIRCTRDYRRAYTTGHTIIGNGSCMSTNPSSVAFDPPLDYSKSYAMALDKLNDITRGNLNLSVDIAEYRQVHRMLSLQDRAIDYTKLFMKKRFGVIKAIANARLEYMYGIKPLLSSIFGAADELQRQVFTSTKKLRVRSSVNGTGANQKCMIQLYYGPENFLASEVDIKLSTTIGVSMIRHDHDMVRFASLNPLGIAWELMPGSFVADWFFNVGGYLQNLETYLAYNNDFLTGYRSDLAAFSGVLRNSDVIDVNPKGTDKRIATIEGLRFNRQKITQYPSPEKLKLQVNLGSSRLLNGAALLAQFLGAKDESGLRDPGAWQRDHDKRAYRERVNRSRHINFRTILS